MNTYSNSKSDLVKEKQAQERAARQASAAKTVTPSKRGALSAIQNDMQSSDFHVTLGPGRKEGGLNPRASASVSNAAMQAALAKFNLSKK